MSMCSYSTSYIYSDILFTTIRTMHTWSVGFQCISICHKTRATFIFKIAENEDFSMLEKWKLSFLFLKV